jgi:hypothetical protein
MLEPAPGKGPIFVMGAMGTGTTLLRLVLDSHDAIAIPPETGFMRGYKAHKFIPFKWTGRNWAKRLGWSDKELDGELRAFYDRIFMRYVENHGKRRWGEKTPLHIWHWDAMARLFPDAVFVAIVRHPGGSMASNMNRWRFSVNRAATHFERYTREMLRCSAKYSKRTVLLRYEELLLQPEPLLRELIAWLGEEWSDSVLEHHKVQSDRGGKEVVEGRNRVSDPLDVSRISKWTTTINEAQQRRLDKRIGRLAEFMGYSMVDPAVLEPINPRDAPLTSGREVKERMDGFADLELKVRGPVPRFEHYYHPRAFTLQSVKEEEARAAGPTGAPEPKPAGVKGALPAPVRVRLGRARRRVRAALR